MNQTLLFVIGVGVFAITVVASLFYGYFTLDRIHQADEAEAPWSMQRRRGRRQMSRSTVLSRSRRRPRWWGRALPRRFGRHD